MKQVLRMVLLSSSLLVSSLAYAQSAYVAPLNAGLGNGATVSCSACHSASPQSAGNAVLPMANTWRSGANLALSDSDGDGFNNAQEVNGGSTNFNYNTLSPFTIARLVEGSNSTKVVVTGAGIVTETAITDIYTQASIPTPSAGSEIVMNVSPLVPTFPATITFAKGIPVGSKVYTVNFVNKSNVLLTSGVVYNSNGSITVSGLPANTNIVVERVIPVIPAVGAARGGEEEGCVSGSLSTPLLMTFGLLVLGLLLRRKQT